MKPGWNIGQHCYKQAEKKRNEQTIDIEKGQGDVRKMPTRFKNSIKMKSSFFNVLVHMFMGASMTVFMLSILSAMTIIGVVSSNLLPSIRRVLYEWLSTIPAALLKIDLPAPVYGIGLYVGYLLLKEVMWEKLERFCKLMKFSEKERTCRENNIIPKEELDRLLQRCGAHMKERWGVYYVPSRYALAHRDESDRAHTHRAVLHSTETSDKSSICCETKIHSETRAEATKVLRGKPTIWCTVINELPAQIENGQLNPSRF